MTIEEEDFILEYDDNCDRFDLSLLYVKNAKDPAKRSEEFKIYGHSMPLESCLNKIINNRIAKKKNVLNMQEYLAEYKTERKKIYESVSLAPVINKLTKNTESKELDE